LYEESQAKNENASIRALSISLLAGVEDKKALDNLGFFDDCLKSVKAVDAQESPLVAHAVAIALVNFSLDVERQVTIFDAIGMQRLVQWAKSLDSELKVCAAAIVGNAVANEKLTQAIVYEGGLTILVKLLAAPGAPPFKEHAARGLANLALHNDAQIQIVERGALPLLSRIVLDQPMPSFHILRSALRCLNYLSGSATTGATVGEFVGRSPQFGERVEAISKGDNAELAKHATAIVENLAAAAGKPAKKKDALSAVTRMAARRPSLDDLDAWHLSKKEASLSKLAPLKARPVATEKTDDSEKKETITKVKRRVRAAKE